MCRNTGLPGLGCLLSSLSVKEPPCDERNPNPFSTVNRSITSSVEDVKRNRMISNFQRNARIEMSVVQMNVYNQFE